LLVGEVERIDLILLGGNLLKTIQKEATVGFEETNDALVTVSPLTAGQGITVELVSSVKRQYGEYLENLIVAIVNEESYTDVHVKVLDKGAWDYALKARVIAALNRGEAS
jgi:citrate lyase acyl carrier protein